MGRHHLTVEKLAGVKGFTLFRPFTACNSNIISYLGVYTIKILLKSVNPQRSDFRGWFTFFKSGY